QVPFQCLVHSCEHNPAAVMDRTRRQAALPVPTSIFQQMRPTAIYSGRCELIERERADIRRSITSPVNGAGRLQPQNFHMPNVAAIHAQRPYPASSLARGTRSVLPRQYLIGSLSDRSKNAD